MQSDWIRQNCAVQMERVRENYNWQVQNLRDIRHYGSNQVGAVRDQYFDQVRNSSSSSWHNFTNSDFQEYANYYVYLSTYILLLTEKAKHTGQNEL